MPEILFWNYNLKLQLKTKDNIVTVLREIILPAHSLLSDDRMDQRNTSRIIYSVSFTMKHLYLRAGKSLGQKSQTNL
jgi:hypothetical protein